MAGIVSRRLACHRHKLLLSTPCITNLPSRSKVGVFEADRKSGYRKDDKRRNILQNMKDGLPMLKKELGVLGQEVQEKFYADPFMDLKNGDYEYMWKLNSREEVEKWVTTADRDNKEGSSRVSFDVTKNNTAMFHGYLSQKVPLDGVQKRSGYVSMRSPSNFKSFKRKIPYDWSLFNCLVLRVRGDGRPYLINIAMDRFFDINWNDQYNYSLYTRGGPYWQVAKIPFSKFYLSSKGRIQDKQQAIDLTNISNIGISVGDGNEGPFSLEIDYLACMFDANHYEEFAYELYEANPAHVGT